MRGNPEVPPTPSETRRRESGGMRRAASRLSRVAGFVVLVAASAAVGHYVYWTVWFWTPVVMMSPWDGCVREEGDWLDARSTYRLFVGVGAAIGALLALRLFSGGRRAEDRR
jgi:hypothetical protein